MQEAQRKSQEDLDASLKTLTDLRERISSEKVPMAKRLSEMEERLATLRRDNEQVLRDIDSGGFESGELKTELKLRQDEVCLRREPPGRICEELGDPPWRW